MTLLMRDSINASAIPLDNLAAVAGYGDGRWVWSSADWARFQPPIVPLSIVVSALDQGDILDVEMGDAVPGDCPGWADRFSRPGRRLPTIYCDRVTIGAVRQAMGNRAFDWWAATLDGTQFVQGAVAVQYAGSNQTGANYDESIIWDPTWIGLVNGTNTGDTTMSFGSRDEAEGFVDFLYGALLHREPGTAADREGWVNIAMGSGLQSLVDQFVNNPDVVAEQKLINQLVADYVAGKLSGGSTTHTHTTPGATTGPPVVG